MCWNIHTAGIETSPCLCAVVSLKECRHTIPRCKLLSDERRCNLLLTISRTIWVFDLPVSPHEMMASYRLQSHCEVEDLRCTNSLYDNTQKSSWWGTFFHDEQNCIQSSFLRMEKHPHSRYFPGILFKMFFFQVYIWEIIYLSFSHLIDLGEDALMKMMRICALLLNLVHNVEFS